MVSTPNYVFLKNEEYTVVRTVILLLPIINDYVKLDEKLPGQPLTTEFVSDRLADLLNVSVFCFIPHKLSNLCGKIINNNTITIIINITIVIVLICVVSGLTISTVILDF